MSGRGKREITGDCVAQPLQARPKCIPVGRPRGVKALGCRYERAFGAAARPAAAAIGPWYVFADINGRGFCQPDALFRPNSGEYVVAECKLTDWASAERELRTLYVPVVAAAHHTRACGLIILRYLSPEIDPRRVCTTLQEALFAATKVTVPPILHWLGKGPL